MNVLLIYPKYPDTFWSFTHILKFVSKKATFPPLGLLTVASIFPSEWNKKLIDVNVKELTNKDIEWADLVLISAMIVQKESAQEIIDRCKAKGKIIIAGGPVFTTQHEKFKNVDHFILNEGEITIPQFISDFKKGKPKKFYTSTERPDITKTPLPMWKLINFKDYVTIAVQYSRGCPFNCEFCDIIIMNGRIPRTKTPEQMILELSTLYRAGWRGSVFVVDDNFIGNKVNVKQFLPLLINWQKKNNYPFKFLTEASLNLADDLELMRLMSRANFHKVFLGLETPHIDSLKECGKFQNYTRDLVKSVRIIQQNGMQVMGGFIVGFDKDTKLIFDAQIKFIQEIGVVTAMVGMLMALPQTRLWHRLKEENRLFSEASGENTDGRLNFIPRMGTKNLVEGYKKILATIYSPNNYYKRIDTFIRHYRPTVRETPSLSGLKAFVKSVWKIGIFSRSRRYYWRLIFKTLFTKIKAFPTAVEMAICGVHFEKITKKVLKSNMS
ncbi:B12-binding domain-containing radical SAM protein [Candidatus Woesearchaeota archaeon CG_4_10_14_0_2_um_filter_33_13]|nr:MAG: B12-binding domain-containing radical SAM protein [Candidatus Woesearchaeota archaeon CG_4_10_14_0_2_um_filter_33_13]